MSHPQGIERTGQLRQDILAWSLYSGLGLQLLRGSEDAVSVALAGR